MKNILDCKLNLASFIGLVFLDLNPNFLSANFLQKFDINSYITTEVCTIFQEGNKNRGEYLLVFAFFSGSFDDSGGTPFVKSLWRINTDKYF